LKQLRYLVASGAQNSRAKNPASALLQLAAKTHGQQGGSAYVHPGPELGLGITLGDKSVQVITAAVQLTSQLISGRQRKAQQQRGATDMPGDQRL
jgi:hypothetical protein